MKFLKAHYENFGPFTEVELGLSDLGLVLVQGDNRVNASAESNGSGKSFLLEGLVYGLFGKTIRGVGPDEVVRNHDKGGKNCLVEITIEHAGSEIRVQRYRKHKEGKNSVQVFVDGVDRTLGTNKETDAFICDLLGMDYATFVRSVYFDGSRIIAFPTLTDKEIKAVFEKMLSLEDLSRVSDAVRKRVSATKSAITFIDSEIALLQSTSSTAMVEAMTARDRLAKYEDQRAAEIKALEDKAAEVRASMLDPKTFADERAEIDAEAAGIKYRVDAMKDLDDVIRRNNEEASAKEREIAELLAEKKTLNALLPNIHTRVDSRLLVEKARIEGEIARLNREAHEASRVMQDAEAKIGTPCGECGKPYEAGDLEHIRQHAGKRYDACAGEAASFGAEIEKVEAQIAEAAAEAERSTRERIEVIEREIADREKERAEIVDKRAKFDKLIHLRASAQSELLGLSERRKLIDMREHQNASLGARIAELEAKRDELAARPNPYDEDIKRWEERKREADDRIAVKQTEKAKHNDDLRLLDVLDKAYGRAGLKAHILETVTPILNERANEYAVRLTDGTVQIEFSTVTKNKDGSLAERFSVQVVNDQGAEGYLANSSGERKKIDLAIALAMSDLVAARASRPIDLFVCDEVGESLDSTALERVVELLHEKAAERGSLLVISHTDMRSWIPNAITVQKTATGSRIAA